jgi:tol-pal system protein YbgF
MTVLNMCPAFPRWLVTVFFAVAVLALQPVQVHAQALDNQALLDRIDRLERDIRTLNRQIATVASPSQGATSTPETGAADSFTTSTSSEGAISRVMVRQAELEQEIRNATGLAESMAHNIDLANARLDKLIVDLDYRLSRLEGSAPGSLSSSVNAVQGNPEISTAPSITSVTKAGGMPPPTDLPSALSGTLGTMPQASLDRILAEKKAVDSQGGDVQTPSLAPSETPSQMATAPQTAPADTPDASVGDAPVAAEPTVQDQYKMAFNLTRQARYQEAEMAFKKFVEAHENDPLAGNAMYWLGETHYVRKDFMQAAQVFFQAYQKFPKGAKAPDSLLKLGMSMASMKKSAEACATFGKLRKEFGSDLKANIKGALDRETQRLACK